MILFQLLILCLSLITGQRVIGEPVVSGLILNDSVLWDPDFSIAAKQVPPVVLLCFPFTNLPVLFTFCFLSFFFVSDMS